jgi:hypothetical protein
MNSSGGVAALMRGDPAMPNDENVVSNAVKLFGETVLPGASLIVSGRVGAGLLHTALGIASTAVLGPVGMFGRVVPFLIAANSFNRSVNDRNLWEGVDIMGRGESVERARPSSTTKS